VVGNDSRSKKNVRGGRHSPRSLKESVFRKQALGNITKSSKVAGEKSGQGG